MCFSKFCGNKATLLENMFFSRFRKFSAKKGEKRGKNKVLGEKTRFSQMLCNLLEKLLKACFPWFSIISEQKW